MSREWIVIHLAAIINSKGDVKAQEEVNFNRTIQLIEWSNENAKRFIYTSSIVAFGGTPFPQWRTEKDYDDYHWLNRLDGYSITKRHAHDEVLRRSRIGTSILCPGIIHGSYEHLKSSRAHLKRVLQGKVRIVPGGGGAFVGLAHVRDEILKSALDDGFDSDFHVKMVSDVCMPYGEYFNLYRESAGLPAIAVCRLPSIFAYPVGVLCAFCKLVRIPAPLVGKLLQALLFYYFRGPKSYEEGKAILRQAMQHSHEKKS